MSPIIEQLSYYERLEQIYQNLHDMRDRLEFLLEQLDTILTE